MFDMLRNEGTTPKLYASQGELPNNIDDKHPPSKKKPFSTILNQPFTHSAQVILPEELYELVWNDVSTKLPSLEYSRIIMPLSALLEGNFFNQYIKSGNIMMLSEGRAGIDSLYSIKDGTHQQNFMITLKRPILMHRCRTEYSQIDVGLLRLELPKDLYERAGLVGQPIRDVGRKHMKTRFGKCVRD
ncbi:MAG: hypothetical protein Q9181_005254 [Wetmoreana brouardii]